MKLLHYCTLVIHGLFLFEYLDCIDRIWLRRL